MDQEKRAPIGIIGAMDEELAMLKAAAGATECETLAGMEFCCGKLGGREVVIVKSGIGKVNAGVCAQLLITCFGVCRIINTGVGGALDPRLNIGDVVISTDVVQHDFDVSPIGFAKGEIPYTGKYAFPADEALRAAAVPETLGKGGLLLDSSDPAEAAAAIDRILTDSALRDRLAEEQKRKLPEYSYGNVRDRLLGYLKKFIG